MNHPDHIARVKQLSNMQTKQSCCNRTLQVKDYLIQLLFPQKLIYLMQVGIYMLLRDVLYRQKKDVLLKQEFH